MAPIVIHLLLCVMIANRPTQGANTSRHGKGSGSSSWIRKVETHLEQACDPDSMLSMKYGFCFPDADAVVKSLLEAGRRLDGHEFLSVLHHIVVTFMTWPPAWTKIANVLNPRKPWTQHYCNKVIGEESFEPDYLLYPARAKFVRSTRQTPDEVSTYRVWFAQLRATRNSEIATLLDAVTQEDKLAEQNGFLRRAPLDNLVSYLHAEPLRHIVTVACQNSSQAKSQIIASTGDALHWAAAHGDRYLAEALIDARPEDERGSYVSAMDPDGYSPYYLAMQGNFQEIAVMIQAIRNDSTAQSAWSPSHSMSPQTGPRRVTSRSNASQCRTPSEKGHHDPTCAETVENSEHVCSGGWNCNVPPSVAAAWLHAEDIQCVADVVHAGEFNWTSFVSSYLKTRRPVLVKGGGKMRSEIAKHYTREGLLQKAGARPVSSFRVPYGDEYADEEPVVVSLGDYVDSLRKRDHELANTSNYVFIKIQREDSEALDFTLALPELLDGREEIVTDDEAQFYVGGVLMGAPLHYHNHAVNSLQHGKKLWFLLPPANGGWSNVPIQDLLARTDGLPDAGRCLQEAEDMLFIPAGWTHGAICLSDCVGVAQEFYAKA